MACIAVVTLVLAAVWFLGKPWHRSAERHRAWRRRIFGAWSRDVLALVGARITTRGVPLPGPCFLVANHHGWHDILAFAAQVDCVFVSMGEIRGWPLVGTMARAFDTILIDRKERREIPRVNAQIQAALARGERVCFFPESRTTSGARVEHFHSALFENAALSGSPVGWAAVRFHTGPKDPPPARVVAWAARPFEQYLRGILLADRVEIEIVFGEGALVGTDRKALAHEAEEQVRSLFVPLEGAELP
ncbi:MAG: 1-acyl-sn-glycerol-3-phosphate acyltransferase [Planctomycetes bacterium]|nr:1-acyl-sn-glycerol-3-phosphate acyltransferase [Planctomycetota bacterium]